MKNHSDRHRWENATRYVETRVMVGLWGEAVLIKAWGGKRVTGWAICEQSPFGLSRLRKSWPRSLKPGSSAATAKSQGYETSVPNNSHPALRGRVRMQPIFERHIHSCLPALPRRPKSLQHFG
jgi:hypothetical protein